MTEWLFREESYKPQSDRDTFINKSILSFLHLLSRMKSQGAAGTDIFKVNAAIKCAAVFLLAILLSLSGSFAFAVVADVYVLVLLSLMRAEDITAILKVSFVMSFFTGLILLPSAFAGYGFNSIMIIMKVFATVTAVNILSRSTRWHALTRALKRFFIPDIFILVLDITIKYIVMLGEFSLNMLYSLKLRSVGRNRSKYTSISGIAGTMFIKSREMSEDMYSAMACRGFTGEYKNYDRFKISLADLVCIAINAGLVFAFFYLGGLK